MHFVCVRTVRAQIRGCGSDGKFTNQSSRSLVRFSESARFSVSCELLLLSLLCKPFQCDV